jgi:ABC-2 type transport system ATP-binding protein
VNPAQTEAKTPRFDRSAEQPEGDAAIRVEGVSKVFRIPTHRPDTLKERVVRPFSSGPTHELRALDDVSFEVGTGEFFGVVGRNGSGKSTLLKLMASIYRADAGRILVAGKIAPFIELGVGFNLEFSAHENVLLNGVMMGLTRQEAARRFDQVMDFAELEEYGDLKLKNYSSGMLTRLAFSLMVQADCDVLLIDEVLAVGDASFQRKCWEVFTELRGKRTIVFVTHDMMAVERFCHRAMLIDRGRVQQVGEPERVAAAYVNLNAPVSGRADGAGPGEGFEAVWIENEKGERPYTVRHGEEISFNAIVEPDQAVERPQFCFQVRNSAGSWVFAFPYMPAAPGRDRIEAGESVRVRAAIRSPFAGGQYSVDGTLVAAEREDDLIASVQDALTFVADGPGPIGGVAPFDEDVEHEGSPESEDG